MADKFFNFIKSPKFLNIFSYAFCGLYIVFVFCFALSSVIETKNFEKQFSEMMERANAINLKAEQYRQSNTQIDEEEQSIEPIFSDGKTAFITAYNNTVGAKSVYAEAYGTSTTTVSGIDMELKLKYQCIRYNETKCYDSRNTLLVKTSAGALKSIIEGMANCAVKSMKENGSVYFYKTNKLYLDGEYPEANYSGISKSRDDDAVMIAENMYIINEETVKSVTFFKIKKDKDGSPIYNVAVELDGQKACANFGKIMQTGAEATEFPTFEKNTISAIIDNSGHIITMTAVDKFTIKKEALGKINDCPMTTILNYEFFCINEEITDEICKVEGF